MEEPRKLIPWRPQRADQDAQEQPQPAKADRQSMIFDGGELQIPEQQALYHALQKNNMENILLLPDNAFKGESWYEDIGRITTVETSVLTDESEEVNITNNNQAILEMMNENITEVRHTLHARNKSGRENRITVNGELALHDVGRNNDEIAPVVIVTQENRMKPDDLTAVLMKSFHRTNNHPDDDSPAIQNIKADFYYSRLAYTTLKQEMSIRVYLERAVRNYVHLERATAYRQGKDMPKGWTAKITVSPEGQIHVETNEQE